MALHKLLILLATIAVISSAVEAQAQKKPKCRGGRAGCPEYEQVHTLQAEAELRRYYGGLWVARRAPPDTFIYTCEYSYYYLGDYFRGDNYEEKVMNITTPMVVTLDVWDMRAEREARFFISETPSRRVAPPLYPTQLVQEPERWYYVREMKQTMDFREIMHETFTMMADLVVGRQPLVMKTVHLAMYNYPKDIDNPYTGPNEIWLEKPALGRGPGKKEKREKKDWRWQWQGEEEEGVENGLTYEEEGVENGLNYEYTAEELRAMAEEWLAKDEEEAARLNPFGSKIESFVT